MAGDKRTDIVTRCVLCLVAIKPVVERFRFIAWWWLKVEKALSARIDLAAEDCQLVLQSQLRVIVQEANGGDAIGRSRLPPTLVAAGKVAKKTFPARCPFFGIIR